MSSRRIISAHEILYSLQTSLATSGFIPFVCLVVSWYPIPPLSFFTNFTSGGAWLTRIPKLKSSASIIFLCVKGFPASRTTRIRLHVRAVEITCFPRPRPSAAPSMILFVASDYTKLEGKNIISKDKGDSYCIYQLQPHLPRQI
jgi:hypothetical protein